jgi:hypothetical protein
MRKTETNFMGEMQRCLMSMPSVIRCLVWSEIATGSVKSVDFITPRHRGNSIYIHTYIHTHKHTRARAPCRLDLDQSCCSWVFASSAWFPEVVITLCWASSVNSRLDSFLWHFLRNLVEWLYRCDSVVRPSFVEAGYVYVCVCVCVCVNGARDSAVGWGTVLQAGR